MIVKVVAKKAGGGSFGGLADYMLDEKNEREKVEDYEFTNCSFEKEQVEKNLKEIEFTQNKNTRSKSDKTFHLIVSFQEGENPTVEERRAIELELVKSIGLENNQRLSAYHTNTDNKHIHIAINQVDSEFFNNTVPFQSINKLQIKAIELENKFNLLADNHIPRTAKKERTPQEVHRGIENFKDWAKEQAGEKIKELLKEPQGVKWEELHKTLGELNLELRERGNGFIVCDSEGKLFCKASDVSRELSKSNLEKKLGKFEKPVERVKGDKSFGDTKGDKSKHWEQYRSAEKEKALTKQRALADLKSTYAKQKADLKERGRLERGELKRSTQVYFGGKMPKYKELFEAQQRRGDKLRENFETAKNEIYSKTKSESYKEYLVGEALKGDKSALEIIRTTAKKKEIEGDTLFGNTKDTVIKSSLNPQISKAGEVSYKLSNKGIVVDKGETMSIKDVSKKEDYLQILLLAKEKYGSVLNISGSDEFRAKIVSVAVENKLDVSFEDKTMESIRQKMVGKAKEKEVRENNKTYYEQKQEQKTKRDFKARIKNKIKEKIDGRRADNDKNHVERWRGYISDVRASLRKSTSALENAISNLRGIGRSGGDTHRERIADVQYSKERSIREKDGIIPDRNSRTTTHRERSETLRGNDKASDKTIGDGREQRGRGGIER